MTIVKLKSRAREPGDAFIEGAPDASRPVSYTAPVEDRSLPSPAHAGPINPEPHTEASALASVDSPQGYRKGNKRQITLTITDKLYGQVTALAEKLGQSRASVINSAIYQAVNKGVLND